ncbi:MAG: type I-C CRISPR-associated protein Cas8c/Csd1 [Lachnoclostridium edouardi]|uniref:type I-C CRISPR-associated protein Cas8c/Csd1 n=1 Tax=Lachnoclostridium edouardi TaxID=1926283 RepID=UPI0026DA8400|nr:type I-C CRISPR-associated protein Cas8c/Csd1 [Lachnoclostridium edouardi]MDO4279403.1 type I-C CRISPR-associated protein Cas8c/Csd1 [Lachnoclostridium edouardi]
MNLFNVLCRLYDENESIVGLIDGEKPILLPIYHTTVAAQITVTLDETGKFLRAEIVPNDDNEKRTLIPVTDKSASRTAGIEPHPLCDNLKYLAGDYAVYVRGKDCTKNHQLYMEGLREWAESEFCHPKVRAIYSYLSQGRLINDLVSAKILETNENGLLDSKKKIQIVTQGEAFVRFRIESDSSLEITALEDNTGIFVPECWKDRSLQKSYIKFCQWKEGKKGLSYLTGEYTRISYLQPKKIRHEGDGAKLISSNDETNFTFRGRFLSKEEAFSIGYEDSQKAHNVLKWLIRQQGTNYDSMYLVTWESHLCGLPNWQEDSVKVWEKAEELFDSLDEMEIMWEEALLEDDLDNENQYAGVVGQAEASRFRRAIWGYRKYTNPSSKMYILVLDAATTGRLSMQEFREITASRYLDSLQYWHERCAWEHSKTGENGRYTFIGMVGVKDAAELLYGIEKNGYFSMKGKETIYKEFVKRWMPCVLDGREVPLDLVSLAEHRASSPVSFESRFLWERVLSLACSLIKQQRKIRYKENWTMALDEKCSKRDYLYGRLLAVADRIEYRTFDKDNGRETNAKRYMSAFSQHPYRTWKVLEEKLTAYWGQLKTPERLTYQRLLDEICEMFVIEDFENDNSLNGLYLLGFHNQSYALKIKKEES